MLSAATRMYVKGLLGKALWPWATSMASQFLIRKSQGLVLTFHYIGRPILPGVAEDLFISKCEFRRVLDFISERLTPLPPDAFLQGLCHGTLPRRATLITFDDCPQDTVAEAFPQLTRRGLSACFFVNPGLIAAGRVLPSIELMSLCAGAPAGSYQVHVNPPMRIQIRDEATRAAAYRRLWPLVLACPSPYHPALLRRIREDLGAEKDLTHSQRLAGWGALAELDAGGMLIGNHTMYHSTAAADDIRQFECDVAQAYDAIEGRLGRKTRVFCYPYGRIEERRSDAEAVLRGLNTEFAFVTRGGIADPRGSGCLNLRREDASYSAEATKLAPLLACLR
jgi:peptidoglycan/xylan/chitin deacetylase (PgdA/CDA1 family)